MQPIEERIESVVDRILEDYGNARDIDRLESFRSPDKDVIIDIIEKLRRIIFPGYFSDKCYRFYNQKNNLSMLIEDVVYHLTKQVRLVFESKGQSWEEANEAAQELCLQFFEKLPEIRAYVQTDLQAAYDGDPAASDMAEIIYSYPGLFAITVYRLAHALFELGVPMVPRIMTE